MHKKDYLQRQFEEFGKVLASILSSKKNGNWNEFEKEIEQASLKYSSFELRQLENLDEQGFTTEVINNTVLSYDQRKILANLLFEKMNFYLEKEEPGKFLSVKSKCLALYRHLENDLTQNDFDLDVHYKLEFLKKIS